MHAFGISDQLSRSALGSPVCCGGYISLLPRGPGLSPFFFLEVAKSADTAESMTTSYCVVWTGLVLSLVSSMRVSLCVEDPLDAVTERFESLVSDMTFPTILHGIKCHCAQILQPRPRIRSIVKFHGHWRAEEYLHNYVYSMTARNAIVRNCDCCC